MRCGSASCRRTCCTAREGAAEREEKTSPIETPSIGSREGEAWVSLRAGWSESSKLTFGFGEPSFEDHLDESRAGGLVETGSADLERRFDSLNHQHEGIFGRLRKERKEHAERLCCAGGFNDVLEVTEKAVNDSKDQRECKSV